jgi:hypothetical protein
VNEALAWARRWARRQGAADHELLDVGSTASAESVRAAYHKLARFAHPDLHRATVSAGELEEITDAFARVSNAYSVMMARLRKAAEKEAKDAPPSSKPTTTGPPTTGRTTTRPTTTGPTTGPSSAPPVSGRSPTPSPSSPPPPASGRQTAGTSPLAAPAPSGNPATLPVQAMGTGSTTAPATSAAGPIAPAPAASSAASDGPATSLSSKAMMHYRRAELCLRRGEIIEAKLHLKLAMVADPQSTLLRKALEDLDRR